MWRKNDNFLSAGDLTDFALVSLLGEPLGLSTQLQRVVGDLITGQVGGHDEDGVLALDSATFSVRQPTLQTGGRQVSIVP